MPPRLFIHPRSLDRLIVLVDTKESAGELFRFEYQARAPEPAPADHVHPEQEERIEVLAGTLRCRLDGREQDLRAGQAIVIPAGAPHAVWNADASGCRTVGEFRPALDAQARFEAYFAAA